MARPATGTVLDGLQLILVWALLLHRDKIFRNRPHARARFHRLPELALFTIYRRSGGEPRCPAYGVTGAGMALAAPAGAPFAFTMAWVAAPYLPAAFTCDSTDHLAARCDIPAIRRFPADGAGAGWVVGKHSHGRPPAPLGSAWHWLCIHRGSVGILRSPAPALACAGLRDRLRTRAKSCSSGLVYALVGDPSLAPSRHRPSDLAQPRVYGPTSVRHHDRGRLTSSGTGPARGASTLLRHRSLLPGWRPTSS
jgi:hypothetical protein